MRTTCPSCDTAYTIPDDRIGPKGRKVRCTRCGEQWRISLDDDVGIEAFRAEAVEPFTAAEPSVDDFFASVSTPTDETAADPFETVEAETEATETQPEETPAPSVAAEADVASSEPAVAQPRPGKPASKKPPRGKTRWKTPRMPVVLTRLAPFTGPAVFLAACLLFVGLAVFRATVVSHVPALAGFYRLVGLEVNLRGLDFGPIETLREMADGQPVLVVEGSLANTSGTSREVPALRFALRDADAQELYAWSVDPRATVIAAGDRLRFRTRLVAPPDRAADLQVRFAERRNRQAGLP